MAAPMSQGSDVSLHEGAEELGDDDLYEDDEAGAKTAPAPNPNLARARTSGGPAATNCAHHHHGGIGAAAAAIAAIGAEAANRGHGSSG